MIMDLISCKSVSPLEPTYLQLSKRTKRFGHYLTDLSIGMRQQRKKRSEKSASGLSPTTPSTSTTRRRTLIVPWSSLLCALPRP